jgi:ABC-type Fe3+/spermidine/putrescine transport system ATPase subunit
VPEIKLVNVTKRFGRIIANDHITFTIKDGEYVSVIGPSGCGKTTLIKNVAGILKPDEGEIFIDGQLVNNVAIEDRGIGYVFQNIALFPHMTVWDNIIYGSQFRGVSPEETRSLAIEMMDMIKLAAKPDAYPYELSGGTRQKIAVARALTSKSKLLLLDEPLGALDLKVRSKLRYELKKLVKDLKLTAFHVTHDQEEAMSISDRVIVMKKGRIIEAGNPLDLYIKPKNIFTANFVGEANFLNGIVIKKSKDATVVDVGDGLELIVNKRKEAIGEPIIIAFRPEFVMFEKNTKINRLKGEVVDVIYSGNMYRIRVMLANKRIINAIKIVSFKEQRCNVGEKITITIPPENILTYSYPEEGLDSELALE